jgi:hypothetical protein
MPCGCGATARRRCVQYEPKPLERPTNTFWPIAAAPTASTTSAEEYDKEDTGEEFQVADGHIYSSSMLDASGTLSAVCMILARTGGKKAFNPGL